MKKNLLYLSMLLLVAMFCVGCDKDKDDDKKSSGGSIVGKWTYKDAKVIEFKILNENVPFTAAEERELAESMAGLFEDAGYIEFTANGRCLIESSYYYDNTYQLDGNKIVMIEQGLKYRGTYSIDGNYLHWNWDMLNSDIPDMELFKDLGVTSFIIGFTFTRYGASSRSVNVPASFVEKSYISSALFKQLQSVVLNNTK